VAKSKYAPALFEVMNRQKNTGKLGVPKWWKGGPPGQQPDGGEPDPGDAGTAPQPDPSGVSASPAQAAPTTMADAIPSRIPADEPESDSPGKAVALEQSWPPSSRLPDFRMESGRLQLTMSPIHAAAICGALLIAFIAAYQVGKGFSGSGADKKDAGLAMLNGKPNPSVLDKPAGGSDTPPSRAAIRAPGPGAQLPAEAPPAPPEQEVLKVGSHYVLFDTYPRDHLASAEFVQKWLASTHNIRTVLRERKGRYWLVGVDVSGDKATCDRYAEKIKALGQECSKALINADLPVYALKDPMPFLIASDK
jgi:hypothetical protein